MNISQMRVAIRPMSTSQAIDLGTMMARYWFVPLWQIWVGMALPVFVVVYLPFTLWGVLNESMVGLWGAFLFWWCKPLYEKTMVTWLGHALFGEQQPVKASIKAGLKDLRRFAFTLLIKRRLSTCRQLILPIIQLENPDKDQLSKRLNILSSGQSSGLTWHTIVLFHFEGFILFGLLALLAALVPTQFMNAETYFTFVEHEGWFDIIMPVLGFFITSIIAPFFVAGGFAVYLTKRCLLEGWDIELTYKQLARRYQLEQANPLKTSRHTPPSNEADFASAAKSGGQGSGR